MWSKRSILLVSAVLVTSVACGGGGGGGSPAAPPPAASLVVVNMRNMSFDPMQVQIAPGDTVQFIRRESQPDHTTTAMSGRWDSGFVFPNAGDMFQVTFTDADADQTFEYFCQTHRDDGMKGSIQVGANAPPPIEGY